MDQTGVIEDASIVSVKKSDQNSTLMESKNGNGGASLCPVTPYLTEEKLKFTSVMKLKNHDGDGLSTPIEDVFDPHKLLMPDPNQKNNLENSAARKLDFGDSSECVCEKGSLMETVYESILESIISKQAEDIIAETLALELTHDVVMTPPSAARLAGSPECPGAPLKPKRVRKLMNVNRNLCRKLEFDSLV